jgi:long-chain acyl-CoA synthetase
MGGLERTEAVRVGGVELDTEAVRDSCRTSLAASKAPRRVVVVEDLPRSMIGKVLHREVRDSLLHG